MTKYTLKQLNELFKKSYPTGQIWRDQGNNYNVAYETQGKVYNYYCTNLYQLALKLKLTTNDDIKKMKNNRPQPEIQEDIFAFLD